MGASSTGGGMTRGRSGSEVEPWTGVSFGILRRVDGDEDLAPRVLTMVESAKTAGVVHELLKRRGKREGALAWLLLVPF